MPCKTETTTAAKTARSQRIVTRTLPGWHGTYSVYRDWIILTNASDGYTVTARWSFDGVRLRFTDVGLKATDALVWGSHPWLKTA
jgi:hypothetical protein